MEIFTGNEIKIFSTVSQLTGRIKNTLNKNFSEIWVSGEVSNFYCHNKRHLYFDLKDDESKIRVVMFHDDVRNLDFIIEDGLQIKLFGNVSVYEKRGEYQLIAEIAEKVGSGDLLLALEQLRGKLKNLGYFDSEYKKPVPILPEKIGAITSTGGAVIRDIVSVLSARFDNFHLIVRNVNVQGKSSADEICQAIDDLCNYGVDVIIIARGGGSLEDLWAFNTEKVAERVFGCEVPVISAIGHESDHTITDDVSDLRAATPSVAASLAIMDKSDYLEKISILVNRAENFLNMKIRRALREVYFLIERRTFQKPKTVILKSWQDFDLVNKSFMEKSELIVKNRIDIFNQTAKFLNKRNINDRINTGRIILGNCYKKIYPSFKKYTTDKKNTVALLLKDLHAGSPVKVIEKGYAFLTEKTENKYIRSVSDVEKGQEINIFLQDGIIFSKVLDKINKRLDWKDKNGK